MTGNLITVTGIVVRRPESPVFDVTYFALRFEADIAANRVMTPIPTPITVIGKEAAGAATKLRPGDKVTVTGHLETHQVRLQDGNYQVVTRICVRDTEGIIKADDRAGR